MVIVLIVIGIILFIAIENVAENIKKASAQQTELQEELITKTVEILNKLDKFDEIDDWFLKKGIKK